ncbi:Succinate-semialdehyde dehydrogenase [Pseudomonas ficuserectae]|nr:Succinate-semialdehyde dehydrogenase [Pseudomonas ficuserectae]RMS39192.1 Succinate-semialdehyde dehydrogenase [Pseudomonas ficuserectae]
MEIFMYPDVQLYIDGQWRASRDGRSIPVIDPATGQSLGSVAHAGITDLDEALAAAERGFATWRATSAYDPTS